MSLIRPASPISRSSRRRVQGVSVLLKGDGRGRLEPADFPFASLLGRQQRRRLSQLKVPAVPGHHQPTKGSRSFLFHNELYRSSPMHSAGRNLARTERNRPASNRRIAIPTRITHVRYLVLISVLSKLSKSVVRTTNTSFTGGCNKHRAFLPPMMVRYLPWESFVASHHTHSAPPA